MSTNPARTFAKGFELYRCRIVKDRSRINRETGFFGYDAKDSFVPPVGSTRDLRANYRYIPYLYCANHPYIALIEVRPRLGACVSVATIRINEKISLLDFTIQNKTSKMSEAKINLFTDLSMLYSKPITDDDEILDYIPTQYIAEYAKNLDYDGIVYRSSLTPELNEENAKTYRNMDRYNIVIFNYDKCEPVKSNMIEVTTNHFECRQIDGDKIHLSIQSPFVEALSNIIG